MKSLRSLDDLVVVNLNSLRGKPSERETNLASCELFRQQLLASYATRTDILETCLPLAEKQLSESRGQGLEHRKKLELLLNERTVEEIIRLRTAEVFKDRCRPLSIDAEARLR